MKDTTEKYRCENEASVSRRDLLIGGGVLAAGMLLTKGSGLLGTAKAETLSKTWPWPYVKLDPTETAELAYKEWYRVFCGAAVISSVFSQLAEKVGEPYASFPVDGFYFMAGGVSDWGTLCGSCNGAVTVANLIIGPKIHGHKVSFTMSSNLLDYYSNTKMPAFVPKNPKIDPAKIPQTQSDSPLCHISVNKWMTAAGVPLPSPERKDRCARMAASMAYRVVENLNEWKDGKYDVDDNHWFAPGEVGTNAQQNCTDCHGNNIPEPPMPKA